MIKFKLYNGLPSSLKVISNLVDGAPPNNSTYCPIELIFVGKFKSDLVPLIAFSVYPTNAGTDVGTETIEFPNELFSSINTPGVAKFDAMIFFYKSIIFFIQV